MIDKTFVEAIQNSVETKVVTVDGKEYATRHVFNPPLPEEFTARQLDIETLSGLVDYFNASASLDGLVPVELVFHVQSHACVSLVSKLRSPRRTREVFAQAECREYGFEFNTFMTHAKFMIGLQSQFLDFGDRAKVLQVVGTIRDEKVNTSTDDGVSQRVTATAGIALVQEVTLPNPVLLRPFRTFLEIDQPPSAFILRVQAGKGGLPDVALFEADGGHWKREAVVGIREYLASKTAGSAILA